MNKSIFTLVTAASLAVLLTSCSSGANPFQSARIAECESLVTDNLVGGLMGYDSISFSNESYSDQGSGTAVITGSYSGDGGMLGLAESMSGETANTFQCSVSGTDVTLDSN